jgi:hypothetical protein
MQKNIRKNRKLEMQKRQQAMQEIIETRKIEVDEKLKNA